MDPVTAQAIQSLADRVTRLEVSQHPARIPIAVSILAVVVSGTLSGWSLLNGARQSKAVMLQAIKTNIDAVKAQIESVPMQFAPLFATENPDPQQEAELKVMRQALDSMVERLLNAYEDGCMKYFGKLVDKQDFVQAYHQDIVASVAQYKDKFAPPLTRFNSIIRYFEQEHKRLKR